MEGFDVLISVATDGPAPEPVASRELLQSPVSVLRQYDFHGQLLQFAPGSRPHRYFGYLGSVYAEYVVTGLLGLLERIEENHSISFASKKSVSYSFESGSGVFRWPSASVEISAQHLTEDCLHVLRLLFDLNCKIYDFRDQAGLSFENADVASMKWDQLWDHIDSAKR
jgi:hypothetical protein